MKTVQIKVFDFNELSDEAKRHACDAWRNNGNIDYAWGAESRQSIEAFCAHFRVQLLNFNVGPYEPYWYKTDAENKHFRGRKLSSIDREYTPTGYCLDTTLWYTFYDIFKKTGNAKYAFTEALDEGFKDWRKDMEWQLSDEFIEEELVANGYQFLETGKVFYS